MQRFFHFIELERLDDGFDLLHPESFQCCEAISFKARQRQAVLGLDGIAW
jgi:hypothetical protein